MKNIMKCVYGNKILFSLIASALMISAFGFSMAVEQNNYIEAGPVGMVVAALLTVVIAASILPTLANQSNVLAVDTPGDLDTTSETLIGLWPLFVIIGVSIALLAFAL